MPTVVHEHVGACDCPSCGKEIPVKKTATGKLSLKCRWCDYETYAAPGTIVYTNTLAKVRLAAAPAPAAATAAAGDAGSAPAANGKYGLRP